MSTVKFKLTTDNSYTKELYDDTVDGLPTISKVIEELMELQKKHGDLPCIMMIPHYICGGDNDFYESFDYNVTTNVYGEKLLEIFMD